MNAANDDPAQEIGVIKGGDLKLEGLLGVADRLGSIEVGKMANLVICDGHLLQPATQVHGLFIAGKPLTPECRHTELYNRYRERLRQVRAGKAPLGVQPGVAAEVARQPEDGE